MSLAMNGKRQHKEHLYILFAQVASALANPHRLELLDLLVQSPRTVDDLAQESHMTVANTSQHLQRLKQANLVADARDGLYVRYQLADPAVARLWLDLRSVGEKQLAEVERALDAYRDHRHEFATVAPEELPILLQRDEITLLDVRPRLEYQSGHIPGAVSIPVDELEFHLDEIPRDKTVVAYCRGPYCVYADQALDLLSGQGWKVARLEEGVAEWQQAGYDLEK